MALFTPAAGGPHLHVDDTGGGGLPIVFQHGLCGDARQTAEIFPDDPQFRRITLEMRGHGSSEAGDPKLFSIARFTEDVFALIEAQRLGPVVAGGISMGAAIAMRLAVMRPDLVSALIIVRPAWSLHQAPPNMQPNAEVGALLRHLTADEARARFMAGATARHLAAAAPDNLVSLQGFFARQPQAVTAQLLQSISTDGPDLTADQLRALNLPTLVIGSELDHVHPLALAEELAGLIPRARLVEVTPKAIDRGRYVSDCRAALASFLKGLPR